MQTRRPTSRRRDRRAFSLLEAMIACVVLGISVLALCSAIAAGQRTSIDGQKRVLAAMAANDLLSELSAEPYADLDKHNGRAENVGELATLDAAEYPVTYWLIGRRLLVEEQIIEDEDLGVAIRGRRLVVTAFDDERDLLSVERFIAEPAS